MSNPLSDVGPVVGDKVQYRNSDGIKVGTLCSVWDEILSHGGHVTMCTIRLQNLAYTTLPFSSVSKVHEPVRCRGVINIYGALCRCEKTEHNSLDWHVTTWESSFNARTLTVKWMDKDAQK